MLLGTVSTQNMERKENLRAPITWLQTYHYLSECLLPEIAQLIFSFHFDASAIDYTKLLTLIEESCKGPASFVDSIRTLLRSNGASLAAEIFECRFFAHAQISICDIKNERNWTVLHQAAYNGHSDIVKIFLNIAGKKTDELLTMKSDYGYTALHSAAHKGRTDIIKILLNAAGENAWTLMIEQNEWGETALHLSVDNNHIEIVTLLLNAAGNRAHELIAITGFKRKTAFDYASPEIKEIMEKHCQNNQ